MTPGTEPGKEGSGRLDPPSIRPEGPLGISGRIWWILLLALALRGIGWLQFDPVTFDSAYYFEIAAHMQAGRWSDASGSHPLYPLLIAGLQGLRLSAETAGVLVAATADLLVLPAIVAITRLAIGGRVAWAAAFLWAVHPSAIRLGVQALADAPMALCVAVGLYAGLRGLERNSLLWATGAGLASGLAYLLRPEGMELGVALSAYYARYGGEAIQQPAERGRVRSFRWPLPLRPGRWVIRRAAWILAPMLGWAIIASPYVAYISLEGGSLTFSKKKSISAIVRSLVPLPGDRGQGEGREVPQERLASGEGSRVWQPEGFPAIPGVENPPGHPTGVDSPQATAWLRRVGQAVYTFQKPLVNGLNPLLIVLACLGLGYARKQEDPRRRRAQSLLIGLLALHLALMIGLAAQLGAAYPGRHLFLLMVLYALPFAGAGLVCGLTWLSSRFRGRQRVPAIALGLIVAGTALSLVTRGPDQGAALRPAAAWIRSQVSDTPVIVTNLHKLTFHARAERVDLYGTYDEIVHRVRTRSAHFLAFYPNVLAGVSPDFLTGLNGSDLELVKTFPEPSRSSRGQRLEIYRLRSR